MDPRNFINYDAIPDDNTFPSGVYQVKCEALEDGHSSSGNRMFRGRFRVVAPTEYAGLSHFEYFVTGNEQDRDGLIPGSMGMMNLKKFWNSAQVPRVNDIPIMCQTSVGMQCLIKVVQVEDTNPESPYVGQKQNKIMKWARVGELPVGLDPQGQVGATTAAAPVGAPTAPAPPAAAPAPAPGPAPGSAAAPGFVATPPGPAPGPAPAPAAAPGPQAPPAAPAAPASGSVLCGYCNTYVSHAEFPAHVAAHQRDAGIQ